MWGSSPSIESFCHGAANSNQGTPARHSTSMLQGVRRWVQDLPQRLPPIACRGGRSLAAGRSSPLLAAGMPPAAGRADAGLNASQNDQPAAVRLVLGRVSASHWQPAEAKQG